MNATTSDILNRLEGVHPAGPGKWRAVCPAHDDRNPSLSIAEGNDGRVLLHCFAGCTFPNVMTALGLPAGNGHASPTPQQPKHVKAGKPSGRVVAVYDYCDASGRVLFQKRRFEPKSFDICRPDGRGGWLWGLGDLEPVLYRLPELARLERPEVVYVVEGEKDADRLAGLGLTATTNFDGAGVPGGRSKWRPDYNARFKGLTVYILPDNDEAGQAHAAAIAGNLHGLAGCVKVVELPGLSERGDVSDWLDDGRTREELEHVCLMTPIWKPADVSSLKMEAQTAEGDGHVLRPKPLAELLQQEFPPLVFLVDGILAKGNLAMLGGRPKSGKSWLALQLAQAVDSRQPFLGRATTQGRVLLIALEDGERRVYQRCQLLKWQPNEAAVLFTIARFDGSGGPGPGLSQVTHFAGSFDLIIVDTLIATLSGLANENDNVQMGLIVNELARLAHETNTAILLVHHTGKGVSENVFDLLRGASALRGGYDLGLLLERKHGEREAVLHMESRDVDLSSMTIRQVENGAGWESLGSGEEIRRIRAGRAVVEAMRLHGDGLTADELAESMNKARQTVHEQLKLAERDGLVRREQREKGEGEKGRPADVWLLVA